MLSQTTSLFTPRFVVMCGFSFTVFLSAFQLLPVAPFRILDMGGTTVTAGLFLGLLTYASALSAPFTGAFADWLGRRRQLLVCSLAITALSGVYALAARPAMLLAIVLIHGVVWSGLLSASAAYTMELIPADRRAEGIGYYGLASVLAIAVAPSIGLWVYGAGWRWLCASIGALNLVMAAIAWRIPDDRPARALSAPANQGRVIEWHVTLAAVTLFLAAFGYGGVTSFVALMADQAGLRPRALYFTVLALAILASRPFAGRLADRAGAERVLPPALVLAACGYALLALPPSYGAHVTSAVLVGLGFGAVYPVFAAWVFEHVPATVRGAAFGGMLAALDTGIGSGSIAVGWIAGRFGFRAAFALGAVLALIAVPYFGHVAKRALARRPGMSPPHLRSPRVP